MVFLLAKCWSFFNTSSMLWSLNTSTRCSLVTRMMLCAVIQSSHQNAQHWKQYKLCALLLSQFPHFTPVEFHSLIANASSKLLIRKMVGKSFRFPLPETLLSLLHSGYVMISWWPLVRRTLFKQWRQELCELGSCFGSENVVMHTEHDTSSWRLSSKACIFMTKDGKINWLCLEMKIPPTMEPWDMNIPYFFLACMWRHEILKSKIKELPKFLSSSGRRGANFISVYNFSAQ